MLSLVISFMRDSPQWRPRSPQCGRAGRKSGSKAWRRRDTGRAKQSLISRYAFQGPISVHSLSEILPDFWAKARYGEYEYGSRHAPWRGRGGRPDELVRRSSPSPPPPAYRPDCPGIHPAREYRWRCKAPCHGEARSARKSVVWGKSVSVRVDLGGRRVHKKKKNKR